MLSVFVSATLSIYISIASEVFETSHILTNFASFAVLKAPPQLFQSNEPYSYASVTHLNASVSSLTLSP